MSDDADRADETLEFLLSLELRKAQHCAHPEATGTCLNCGAFVTDGARWCDADCRDDWERRQ